MFFWLEFKKLRYGLFILRGFSICLSRRIRNFGGDWRLRQFLPRQDVYFVGFQKLRYGLCTLGGSSICLSRRISSFGCDWKLIYHLSMKICCFVQGFWSRARFFHFVSFECLPCVVIGMRHRLRTRYLNIYLD